MRKRKLDERFVRSPVRARPAARTLWALGMYMLSGWNALSWWKREEVDLADMIQLFAVRCIEVQERKGFK